MALSSVRQFTRQCSTDFSSGKITFSGAQGSDKHRFTLTMAWHGSVSWFSRALLILTLVSFAINVVAFVSPFWMLVDDALGRSYSGLWTVCIFEVCGDFIHHSMFIWFHVVQAMMCLSLLSQLIVVVSTVLYIVAPVSPRNSKRLLRTIFLTVLLAEASSVTGVVVYGTQQGQRGLDTLSWGFLLAAASSALMLLSTIPLVLEWRMKSTPKEDRRPVLSSPNGSKPPARPELRHSPSVDSCAALRTEEKPSDRPVRLARPRSESQVRMRVNSVSQECPPTPLHGEIEEESGAVFDFDNECFSP